MKKLKLGVAALTLSMAATSLVRKKAINLSLV